MTRDRSARCLDTSVPDFVAWPQMFLRPVVHGTRNSNFSTKYELQTNSRMPEVVSALRFYFCAVALAERTAEVV